MEFQRLLGAVSAELGSADVRALAFLCRDLVPGARLQGLSSALQLFAELQTEALLPPADPFLLTELLYRIRRFRLLRNLNWDKDRSPSLSVFSVTECLSLSVCH
uniref:DED domain-containing protein n=1 Tax=Callorhinchus milii TaxID=7868 RepID=A0A4W3GC70_CALMI